MSRRATFVTIVALLATSFVHAGRAVPAVGADADWLLAVQMPDGMITQGLDRTWCVPYFANIGARGLARAYAVTKDARYASAAWAWLSWYQSHMNASGFVTDYRLSGGTWYSTGTYDSTDSYAATFLSAAAETYRATGDAVRLLRLWTGIRRAASAVEATTDPADGLTYAKPGWGWKYAMDVSEVYEGWTATAEMAAAVGDLPLRQRASARAAAVASSIALLRNGGRGGYDWGVSDIGAHATLDWNQWYPSAVAQAWLVAAGLTTAPEARAIAERLDAVAPSWDDPSSNGTIVDRLAPIGYWPDVARAFLRAGLRSRARAALAAIESAAGSARRFWPYHPGTAGALILLASDAQLSLPDAA